MVDADLMIEILEILDDQLGQLGALRGHGLVILLMPDRLYERTLLRFARDNDLGLHDGLPPIKSQIPLFLVDAVMAFVAVFRQDRTDLFLKELDLLGGQFLGQNRRESGSGKQEH